MVATFAPGENQYLGFGINFSVTPYAIFSNSGAGVLSVHTYLNDSTGNNIDTVINSSSLGTPHRYRIDWSTDSVAYYVDGVLVASHAIAIATPMRPVGFDRNVGNGSLNLAWLRMTPYGSLCTFTLGRVRCRTVCGLARTELNQIYTHGYQRQLRNAYRNCSDT